MLSNRISFFLSISLLAAGLILSIFFVTQENFPSILFAYSLSFVGFIGLMKKEMNKKELGLLFLLIFCIKCSSFFAFPTLSDDVYRFWWDGFIQVNGINPFAYTPKELLSVYSQDFIQTPLSTQYSSLNSKEYYSVYPSFCQLLFYVSSYVSGPNITLFFIVLKCFFLLADAGIFFCFVWLIKKSLIPINSMVMVLCNPLYLIEGLFNFHFEIFVILFILFGWICVQNFRPFLGGMSLGLAVMTKLNPILLLPAFVLQISGIRRKIIFILPCALIMLTLYPLVSPYVYNFFHSVQLYFNKFEFNSFLYRPLTFICEKKAWWVAKNNIGLILTGCFLTLFVVSHVVYFLTSKKSNPLRLFWVILFGFLLCSSTVHPWYILPLLAISSLGVYTWPSIIWSMVIVLSYSQYDPSTLHLEPWLRMVEYGAVLLFFFFELRAPSQFFKAEIIPFPFRRSGN